MLYIVINVENAASKSCMNTGFYNKNTIESELEGLDFNGVFIYTQNEILLCRVKSSLCSDEIENLTVFGEIKSTHPPSRRISPP